MRSAHRCASRTKTCRRRCRAIARRSRSPPAPATNTPTPIPPRAATPTDIVRTEIHGANSPRSAGLTVSQTLFNGQQTANKTRVAESQVSGAREALRVLEQTVLLAGRHDLHGLPARLRHRRGSAQQYPRARTDAETDQGSLQCRRSHAHRRRTVGGAVRGRPNPATHRRIQPDHDAIEFPPHHRQRTGAACAGFAGGSFPAGNAAQCGRTQSLPKIRT